ncbi:MAG: hypothetical protein J6X49_12470 [Victivallales bacterium]|nr:hypothetical protein [Victivallales bacterium]
MKDMDAAGKLFMALDRPFADLVDFFLREEGYRVVRESMRERDPEAIGRPPGGRHRRVVHDVVKEMDVRRLRGRPRRLTVAWANQSYVSRVMPGRELMSSALHWDRWRGGIRSEHERNGELKTPEQWLDGILPGDRMPPVLTLTPYFGQKPWRGANRFVADMLDCPPGLEKAMADCPANVVSFRDMTARQLSAFDAGPMRAVAKCIRYARNHRQLRHEMRTDPSFLDMPAEAYGIINIATGMNLKPRQKEHNDMARDVSSYDQYLLDMGERRGEKKGEKRGEKKGEKKGIAAAIMRFIQSRRSRHFSETQIQEDLQLDFGLDEAQASQYMANSLTAKV